MNLPDPKPVTQLIIDPSEGTEAEKLESAKAIPETEEEQGPLGAMSDSDSEEDTLDTMHSLDLYTDVDEDTPKPLDIEAELERK